MARRSLNRLALLAPALLLVGGLRCQRPERVEPPIQERPLDYRHPLGVGFDLAQGWRVQEGPQGLQLLPRDPKRGPMGDEEFYVVGMIGADPSVRSLDDRRAPGLVQQLVQSQLPFLRAQGEPQRVEGREDLRVYSFAGRSPYGQQLGCRVHGLLFSGWFIACTAIAEPSQLEIRQPAIDRVVRRLQLGAPQADGSLVGTWFSSSLSSAGGIRDRLHVSTTTTTRLSAEGLMWSGTQSTVNGRDRTGGSITGITDELRAAGRWARAGNQLWVVWKNGGAGRYTVHVQGARGRREMLLTPPPGAGGKLLWTEYRL